MPSLGNVPRPAYVYDTETDTWVPVGVGAHTHAYIPNTLVDAKGDLVTATANDVPAILSKGADGTVLVSDSTTQTGLAWQPYGAIQVAGKNMIINGAFDHWQRGTSFASGSFQYSADRWRVGRGAFQANCTFTRQNAGLEGFRYCIRAQRDSGNTLNGGAFVATSFETSDSLRFAGKVVTLSFYAKKSSGYTGGGIEVALQNGTGTDETSFAESNFATGANYIFNTGAFSLTTSWQRFSFTGTVPSNATQLGIRLIVQYSGTAPADDWVDITGIQLEQGPIATSFTRSAGSIQGELAACQRYYYKIGPSDGSSSSFLYSPLGMANATTQVIITFPFPQIMRVKPTSIEYTNPRVSDGANVSTATSLVLGDASSSLGSVNVNGSGFTLFRNYWMMNNSNSSLAFNAEL